MARKKQMTESKELITQALIRLLNEKPLPSISMTQTQGAGSSVFQISYQRQFVATNIFLYAYDSSEPLKKTAGVSGGS